MTEVMGSSDTESLVRINNNTGEPGLESLEEQVRVCGYHCPMSHAMRDWEKGSRNLADLAESEPSHWLGREQAGSRLRDLSRSRCLSH